MFKPSGVTTTDPDLDLYAFINQIRDILNKARSYELRPYGITVMDSAALLLIDGLGEKATPAELARWLWKEHHTVIGQLQRMEKKGFVILTKGLIQKNIISIELTDAGNDALKESLKMQSIHNMFSPLTIDERKQLWSILLKLKISALKELGVEDTTHTLTPPS